MSKALSAVMTIVVDTTTRVGTRSGNTMPRNTCHSVAPSIRAASISSGLIPLSAAEMMTMAKPVHIHAMTMISMKVFTLKDWTWSHGTGPRPPTPMTAFRVPV